MTAPVSAADRFAACSVTELLSQHSQVLSELRRRGICRSSNNPTGDYCEWLVAKQLGLALETNSAKGFDAVDAAGTRYQIKGRRRDTGTRPSQLSAIRGLDDEAFDVLIAVMFEPDWAVKFAAKIPHHVVRDLSVYKPHVNGHVLHLRPGVLARQGVVDLTEILRGAAPVELQGGAG